MCVDACLILLQVLV
uniref:Uncharacterized protein n=1 Tax=Anguilla anguilla TaxID=7936 RepID=A0A0E9W3M5_ANGAN